MSEWIVCSCLGVLVFVLAVLNGNPRRLQPGADLTQSEIDAMNAKGETDMQSGLEKMKIPTTGVEKGKK